MPELTVEEVREMYEWASLWLETSEAEQEPILVDKMKRVMRLCIGYVEMRAREEKREWVKSLANGEIPISFRPWQSLLTKLKGQMK